MLRLTRMMTLSLLCLLASLSAQAQVVFNQPPTFTNFGFFNTLDSYNTSATTYDNFSLLSTASVKDILWQGTFTTAGLNQNPHDTISSFDISFWSDNAGQPGALLQSETISGKANETFVGFSNGTFFNGGPASNNFYDYFTALPTSFKASAGTTYWLSIVAQTPHSDPSWGWASGFGGDNISYQDTSNGRIQRTSDRAFLLAVPESSTFTISASLGLIAVVLLRRKRARQTA